MEKKEKTVIFIVSIIMMVSMIASVYICIRIINRISSENAMGNTLTVASVVEDTIQNKFMRPITVTETMSQDYHLRKLLKECKTTSPESVETEIVSYLNSIYEGFGYQMVYAVSYDTNAFFSSNGLCKYMDIAHDEEDKWYKDYLESGKKYDLNVDTDETNQWSLSIFVNMKVLDENGECLGVCGVGVSMADVLEMLKAFETQYCIKINMMDESGLIQFDTDMQRILKDYLENDYLSQVRGDKFLYEDLVNSNRCTVFMEDMGWYLVIEGDNQNKIDEVRIVAPSIIIFTLGIIFMGVFFVLQDKNAVQRGRKNGVKSLSDIYIAMFLLDTKTNEVSRIKSNSYIDELMGEDYSDLTRMFSGIFHQSCQPEYLQDILEFTDMSTLEERIKGHRTIFCDYVGKVYGWCRARFIISGEEDNSVYIFTVEVINEEKRKQDELQLEVDEMKRKAEAKNKFLENMSCEIKKSIKTILGLDAIVLEESVVEQAKETALQIQEEGNAVLELVENVIDFSKIEAFKLEIEHKEYNFSDMLHAITRKVLKKAQKKGLQLIVDIDENLPSKLGGDENRIRQVLTNILDNAIMRTQKGSVTLAIDGEIICERAMLHFFIADTREAEQREEMTEYTTDFDIDEEQRNIKGKDLAMGIAHYLLVLMGSELSMNTGYDAGVAYQFDLLQEIRCIEPVGVIKV